MRSIKFYEWKVQKGGEKSVFHFMMLSQQLPERIERKDEAILVNISEPWSKKDTANQH
jgi:hypothetical protein